MSVSEEPVSASNSRPMNDNSIPPFYANSPPPIRNHNNDDDDEGDIQLNINDQESANDCKQNISDFNPINLSDSLASAGSTHSLPRIPNDSLFNTTNVIEQLNQLADETAENDLNAYNSKLKDMDEEWMTNSNETNQNDDFFSFNNTSNKEQEAEEEGKEETDSGWANFELTFNLNSNTNTNEVQPLSESFTSFGDKDDDEWGNFVEIDHTNIPHNTYSNKNTNQTNEPEQLQSEKPTVQIDLTNSLPFNLDNILDDLFRSHCFFQDNDTKVNDFIIETDDLWQQIQMFTSVTDSSSSLQFKWCFSNLEENYLNALSLKRTNQSVAKTHLSPQTILQPVKFDKAKQVNSTNLKSNEDTETKSTELGFLSTPALNIDLSYFETNGSDTSGPVALSDNNSKSKKSIPNNNNTKNKSETTSKVYLDKLLEEIFTSNQKASTELKIQAKTVTNSLSKEDDLFSDKKSICSSSSSSSSNINESNYNVSFSATSNSATMQPSILQLQPHLLESQQLQTNRAYDEKALQVLTKLSGVTFKNNSKVIVFPR